MIKIILKGGLGNQMFQYALGKSLSLQYNTDLFLDDSFLKFKIPFNKYIRKGYSYRHYELKSFFGIDEKVGSLFNNKFLDTHFTLPFTMAYNRFINRNFIAEELNPYEFIPKVLVSGPNITLDGHWNNYKYFREHSKEIKDLFNTNRLLDKTFSQLEDDISKTNSVSMHIRRDDYTNERYKEVFTFLDDKYYNKAVDVVKEKVKNPHFWIFAYDGSSWFEKTTSLKRNEYTIVPNSVAKNDFKSFFRLMSICKHNIISNSTFAWWSAYLNKNDHKVSVGPKKWMFKYDFEYEPSWIVLDI